MRRWGRRGKCRGRGPRRGRRDYLWPRGYVPAPTLLDHIISTVVAVLVFAGIVGYLAGVLMMLGALVR